MEDSISDRTESQWRLDRTGLLHGLAKVSRAPRGAHRPALPSRCCRPGSLASCGSLESCLCSHARHPSEAASGLCWTFGATSRICGVGCPLGQPVTASVSCCLHQLLLPRTRHCADGGRRRGRRLYWDPRSCILLVNFLLANIVTVRALVPKCMWYEDVVRISIGQDNTQTLVGHLLVRPMAVARLLQLSRWVALIGSTGKKTPGGAGTQFCEESGVNFGAVL